MSFTLNVCHVIIDSEFQNLLCVVFNIDFDDAFFFIDIYHGPPPETLVEPVLYLESYRIKYI